MPSSSLSATFISLFTDYPSLAKKIGKWTKFVKWSKCFSNLNKFFTVLKIFPRLKY